MRTKAKKMKKPDEYKVQTFVVWMANNRAKMTSLDHREVFRILNSDDLIGRSAAKGGKHEAP